MITYIIHAMNCINASDFKVKYSENVHQQKDNSLTASIFSLIENRIGLACTQYSGHSREKA